MAIRWAACSRRVGRNAVERPPATPGPVQQPGQLDAWRTGITTLRGRLPTRDRAALDRAEEMRNFTGAEYGAAIDTFYRRHLSLARPWPTPEVQAALNWLAADVTTYETM